MKEMEEEILITQTEPMPEYDPNEVVVPKKGRTKGENVWQHIKGKLK